MRLLSALGMVWRYVRYRCAPSHPSTQGTRRLAVDGISGKVDILFDAYGVPHIQAGNEPDLLFGLGYMHGRDRRFQMETLRALAHGELRALFGAGVLPPLLVEQEVLNRMLGFRGIAQRYVQQAPMEDRALLQAYSAGVNAATVHESLPFEFGLLGLQPAPWQAEDAISVAQLLAFGIAKNWEMELSRLEIALFQAAKGHPLQRALEIWKPRFDFPPHLIEGDGSRRQALAAIAPELAAYLERFAHVYGRAQDGAAKQEHATELDVDTIVPRGGSNNWAIGGRWNASGAGALASDPHLPPCLPSLGYLVHLECDADDGYRVIGAGHPGTLGVAFGTNGQVAWGVTANWADVTDLFVEQPTAGDAQRYHDGDADAAFEVVHETFLIRRGPDDYEREVRTARRTRNGLILNGLLARIPAGFPLVALKRDEEVGNPLAALRGLYRASDVRSAGHALATLQIVVGHWALADKSGAIGYQSSGRVPKRHAHRGAFPAPGWRREYAWDGWLAGDDLPRCFDPPSGFIVTANNQVIAPDAFNFSICDEGDVALRIDRARDCFERLLSAGTPLATGRALQTDGIEPGYFALLPLWRGALEKLVRDQERNVAAAADLLLHWDGQCQPNSVAASLYHALCVHLLGANLHGEVAPSTLEFLGRFMNAEPFVMSVLSERSFPGWNSEARISACLRAVVDALSARHGRVLRDWQWKKVAPFMLRHPLGGHGLLAGYVNRGPLPTSGSHNALNKQYTSRAADDCFPVMLAASLRVNIDLGDLAGSTMCAAAGQSGRPGSMHYDDQLGLYLDGGGVSMEMDLDVIRQAAVGTLELRPS